MSTALTGILAAGGTAFLLSALLTPLAMRVARRIGFVDRPGGHKSHREPTPYGGGTAIFLSSWTLIALAVIAAAVAPQDWLAQQFGETARAYAGGLRLRAPMALSILVGGLALHLMGLQDDRRPLGPGVKFLIMAAAGLLVATVGGVRLGVMFGEAVSVLLTVLWIVVLTNAFNFLDNMDGLSAGVAAVCLAFFAASGLSMGQVFVPALACVFLGAIAGFLLYNFPPARIFMGDAGSLLIGYMIAVISILTTYFESGGSAPPIPLAIPLVILAVPLYDFVSVVVIRLAEGRNPLRGDQRHFSHRLVDRGLSRRSAVLTIYLATAATGLSSTLLSHAGLREALTVLAIVAMVLAIIAILEMPQRKDA